MQTPLIIIYIQWQSGYSKQVDAAKASYRRKKNEAVSGTLEEQDEDEDSGAEIVAQGGDLTLKLTGEEFLSGFRKGDKLIPIVTVVVYLGADPWDGPLSLYDMFERKHKDILKYVPNYFINLISPANMEDKEFDKFSTDLRLDFVEKGDEVDMCLAMERKAQRDEITGAIKGMKQLGAKDADIVNTIIEMYGVTKEYVSLTFHDL